MNIDSTETPTAALSSTSRAYSNGRRLSLAGALFALAAIVTAVPSHAQDMKSAPSFVDNFSSLDRSRWYVSDGWANGDYQNCTWSKDLIRLSDGVLSLGFEKRKLKDREYACGEVQTKKRYGYGVYEARMKTDTGSGLNATFFTYIGPSDKQPWDEIDFEVLTKNPSKVQLNTYVQGKPKNTKLVDVEGGADKGFNDYGFVWEKDRLRWYVNGKLVNEVTNPDQLPTHPQKIFLSLWGSEKLTSWMGPFVDPGRNVTMQVKRVAFTAIGEPCQFPESLACSITKSN